MAINYWWKPPDWKQTLEEEKRLKYQLLSDIKEKLQTRFKDQHHHHNQHPDQEL